MLQWKQMFLRGLSYNIVVITSRGVGVRVLVETNSSHLHVVQTDFGAHQASYPMGRGALPPEVKRPGRKADYSLPIIAKVTSICIYTFTLPKSSWRSV
jgi:hypothetical protein